MHKVAYNACYGGFNISEEALHWLEENGSKETKKALKEQRKEAEKEKDKFDGNFTLEQHLTYCAGVIFSRHHPDLIRVIETLGNEASGYCSEIKIAKIKGNLYRIDDYDGCETVVEPEDYTWINVEEE